MKRRRVRIQKGGCACVDGGAKANSSLNYLGIAVLIGLLAAALYIAYILTIGKQPQAQPIIINTGTGGSPRGSVLPPELPHEPNRMPVNIHTRGEPPAPQQVGVLVANPNETNKNTTPIMLPLYGNPTLRGNSRWEYYAGADKDHLWRIPVQVNNRDCSDERVGCEEISQGDHVQVPVYDGVDFTASIYKKQELRYVG